MVIPGKPLCPVEKTTFQLSFIYRARQLVEAKMPTVVSGGKTYAAAASTRRESKSVQCQTSLTWVFSERPLRTTESNVRSSGGPGSKTEVEDGISRRPGSVRVR